MQIYPEKLKDDVLVSQEHQYDPSELDLELVDLKFLSALSFKGTVTKEKDSLKVEGVLTSSVRRICGRTLKEVDEPLTVKFLQYYEISDHAVINTTEDVREAVMLAQPMVYYSPESQVIRDINDREGIQTREKSNPFAKLKKLRNLK